MQSISTVLWTTDVVHFCMKAKKKTCTNLGAGLFDQGLTTWMGLPSQKALM